MNIGKNSCQTVLQVTLTIEDGPFCGCRERHNQVGPHAKPRADISQFDRSWGVKRVKSEEVVVTVRYVDWVTLMQLNVVVSRSLERLPE